MTSLDAVLTALFHLGKAEIEARKSGDELLMLSIGIAMRQARETARAHPPIPLSAEELGLPELKTLAERGRRQGAPSRKRTVAVAA